MMYGDRGDRYASKMTEATCRNSPQEVNRTFIISSRDIAAARLRQREGTV
ncbi:MAG: hypothetical protein F6K15_20035 [Okeania sp. SIO2B3]|nr:hypothetical protein [Okeania sp. SIO2B3]